MTLSKRESQIMRLVARGETDKGVADRLSISPHTVNSHLRRIYQKLRANSRTLAAVRFVGSSK